MTEEGSLFLDPDASITDVARGRKTRIIRFPYGNHAMTIIPMVRFYWPEARYHMLKLIYGHAAQGDLLVFSKPFVLQNADYLGEFARLKKKAEDAGMVRLSDDINWDTLRPVSEILDWVQHLQEHEPELAALLTSTVVRNLTNVAHLDPLTAMDIEITSIAQTGSLPDSMVPKKLKESQQRFFKEAVLGLGRDATVCISLDVAELMGRALKTPGVTPEIWPLWPERT